MITDSFLNYRSQRALEANHQTANELHRTKYVIHILIPIFVVFGHRFDFVILTRDIESKKVEWLQQNLTGQKVR